MSDSTNPAYIENHSFNYNKNIKFYKNSNLFYK